SVRPAFATSVSNGRTMAGALILVGVFGLQSMVIGVITGAVMQIVLQWPALRGLRVRPSRDFSHPALRRALKLYLPVALGFVVTIAGIFIDRNLASRTGEGSLAIMRFATTIIQFPLGLISVALSSAILPTLSRQATSDDGRRTTDDGRKTKEDGGPQTGDATLYPIVGLSEEANVIDGLPATVVRRPSPVVIGVVSVGIYVLAALLLIGPWGMPGLAFANALQNSSHAVILLALLWRAIGGLRGYGIGVTTLKVGGAAAVMGLAVALLLS